MRKGGLVGIPVVKEWVLNPNFLSAEIIDDQLRVVIRYHGTPIMVVSRFRYGYSEAEVAQAHFLKDVTEYMIAQARKRGKMVILAMEGGYYFVPLIILSDTAIPRETEGTVRSATGPRTSFLETHR